MARAISGFAVFEAEGSEWIWLLAFGVATLVLAALAALNLGTATQASVYLVGVLMVVCAFAQLALAVETRGWGEMLLSLLAAALYGAAGVLAFANPALAAAALTLLLGFALIAAGLLRIWWSTWLRALPGWGWLAASGLVTALVGAAFLVGWPADAVWVPGLVLAGDLAFQGAAAIGFGLALKPTDS